MLAPSLARLPVTPAVLADSGLPLGCVVQPLVPTASERGTTAQQTLPRCDGCGAYVNEFCALHKVSWRCCLCGRDNETPESHDVPDLHSDVVELDLGNVDSPPPAYIALVDTSCEGQKLALIRAALHAALAALPDDSVFGLLTVSDTVGVYMLGSPRAHVRHIPIPDRGEPLAVVDAVGEQVVVRTGSCTERIAAAIETIGRSTNIAHARHAAPRRSGEPTTPAEPYGCALGVALQMLVRTLGAIPSAGPARVLCFLGSRPNVGVGALPALPSAGSASDDEGLAPEDARLGPAASAYDAIACDFASLGAAVCLYALCTAAPVGPGALQALTSRTGGTLCYYEDLADGSALPDDVYKQLTSPFASHGILRLRTSPQIAISRSYGPTIQDERMQDLYHIAGCHEDTTVAFAFEYTSSSGFDDGTSAQPILQLAYTYWVLEPHGSDDDDGAQSADGTDECAVPAAQRRPTRRSWGLVRRLRVQTVVLQLAQSMRRLYESLDERVMMMLLTHKVIAAIQQEGYREGRLLLQNWLVGLLAQYQQHYEAHPDCVLYPGELCAPLRAVPQWVYGLLRGPLLASHTPLSAHRLSTDGRTAMYTLYRSLSTDDLVTVLQPVLTAYRNSDSRAEEDLPLSCVGPLEKPSTAVSHHASPRLSLLTQRSPDRVCPPQVGRHATQWLPPLSPRRIHARLPLPCATSVPVR